MCKLFGVIKLSGFNKKNNKYLKELLTKLAVEAKDVNNKDATGIMTIINDGLTFAKDGVESPVFVKSTKWKKFLTVVDKGVFFSGHTRISTHGNANNNKNNHPVVDKATGIGVTHNGIIGNHIDVAKAEKIKLVADVDSEILLQLWKKYRTIEDTVAKPSGSYTFAVLDSSKPNELNMFNYGRSLTLAYLPEVRLLIYATNAGIIERTMTETLIGLFKVSKEKFYIKDIARSHHVHIDVTLPDDQVVTIKYIDVPNWKNPYAKGRVTTYERNIPTHYNNSTPTYDNHRGGASGRGETMGDQKAVQALFDGSSEAQCEYTALAEYPRFSKIRTLNDRFTGVYIKNVTIPSNGTVNFTCDYWFYNNTLKSKCKEWKDLIGEPTYGFDNTKQKGASSYVSVRIAPKITRKKDGHNRLAKLLMELDGKHYNHHSGEEVQLRAPKPLSPCDQYYQTKELDQLNIQLDNLVALQTHCAQPHRYEQEIAELNSKIYLLGMNHQDEIDTTKKDLIERGLY